MKKFLIISFVCLLFSCQNTSKEIIENSKTETEAVAVGQIPENIITKKPNTDEVIDIQIRGSKKNSSDYDFLKDIGSIQELKNFMATYVLPEDIEDIEDREIRCYVNEKFGLVYEIILIIILVRLWRKFFLFFQLVKIF
ncbi:MAG: hypothetical protein ACTTH6_03705 [Candidatus Altimarinota bacterium]